MFKIDCEANKQSLLKIITERNDQDFSVDQNPSLLSNDLEEDNDYKK